MLKKKQFFGCLKLADGRISIKKEEISSYLVYNFFSLGKMAVKIEPFFHEDKLNINLWSNIEKI